MFWALCCQIAINFTTKVILDIKTTFWSTNFASIIHMFFPLLALTELSGYLKQKGHTHKEITHCVR